MKPYIQIEGTLQRRPLPKLKVYMQAMVLINREFYRENPKAPRVIDVCRFNPEEDSKVEHFVTAELMIEKAKLAALLGISPDDSEYPEFDCEDFTCAEVAYLIEILGKDCEPDFIKSPYANKLHAIIRMKDGSIYDPSAKAGMIVP